VDGLARAVPLPAEPASAPASGEVTRGGTAATALPPGEGTGGGAAATAPGSEEAFQGGAARPAPAPGSAEAAAQVSSAVAAPRAVPLVHRPTTARPADRPSLVDAVDEFVGPAREPATPYRPPSWMRSSVPSWMLPTEPDGLPELPFEPPAPAPLAPRPPVQPPQQLTVTAPLRRSGDDEDQPPVSRRRPNLGQSRRLGLGTPVSRPAGAPFVPPDQGGLAPEPTFELGPTPVAQAGSGSSGSLAEDLARLIAAQQQAQASQAVPDNGLPDNGLPDNDVPDRDRAPAPAEPVEPAPARSPATAAVGPGSPETSRPAEPPTEPAAAPPSTAPPAPPVRSAGWVVMAGAPRPAEVVSPIYRSAPGLGPVRLRPAPRARVVQVPADLAGALRSTHGVDTSDVPVRIGPEVSAEARTRGARAFTRGGVVHLPAEAGPPDTPAARGLLAHELVHAVQQRTLGPALPAPDSPHGQALEAEAVAAERYHAGQPGAATPPPLIHAPHLGHQPAASSEAASSYAGEHTQLAPLAPPPAPPAPTGSGSPFASELPTLDPHTRRQVDEIAHQRARQVVQEHWTHPALRGRGPASGTGPGRGTGGGVGSGPGPGGTGAQPAPGEQLTMVMNADGTIEVRAIPTGGGLGRAGPGGAGGRAAAGGAPGGSALGGTSFNRDARRAQLVADRLTMINNDLAARGEPTVSSLTPDQEAAIDEVVNAEERLSGGGSAGAGTPGGGLSQPTGPEQMEMVVNDDGTIEVRPVPPGRSAATSRAGGPAGAGAAATGSPAGTAATAGTGQPAAPAAPAGTGAGAAEGLHAGGHAGEHRTVLGDHVDIDRAVAVLYDRLRSQLRRELLIDRERAGLLTDFR
jgi:hypothetical protein